MAFISPSTPYSGLFLGTFDALSNEEPTTVCLYNTERLNLRGGGSDGPSNRPQYLTIKGLLVMLYLYFLWVLVPLHCSFPVGLLFMCLSNFLLGIIALLSPYSLS